MNDTKLRDPLEVTLRAGEWFWLLGALAQIVGQGENDVVDKLVSQVMDAVD